MRALANMRLSTLATIVFGYVVPLVGFIVCSIIKLIEWLW